MQHDSFPLEKKFKLSLNNLSLLPAQFVSFTYSQQVEVPFFMTSINSFSFFNNVSTFIVQILFLDISSYPFSCSLRLIIIFQSILSIHCVALLCLTQFYQNPVNYPEQCRLPTTWMSGWILGGVAVYLLQMGMHER